MRRPTHAGVNTRMPCQQYMTLLMDPNQPVAFEEGLQELHDNIQTVLDMEPA